MLGWEYRTEGGTVRGRDRSFGRGEDSYKAGDVEKDVHIVDETMPNGD